MAYWVSELHHDGRRSFQCDFRSDIAHLPTENREGTDFGDNPAMAEKVKCGSDVLCLEDASVWVLGKANDAWKEL